MLVNDMNTVKVIQISTWILSSTKNVDILKYVITIVKALLHVVTMKKQRIIVEYFQSTLEQNQVRTIQLTPRNL